MNFEQIIKKLKSLKNPKNIAGMARFGISGKNTLGIPIPVLRQLGKQIGRNHDLALKLWESGIHEARLLACFIDKPEEVTEQQIDLWTKDFDSWDICDQCCSNLFDKTNFAYKKIFEFSNRKGPAHHAKQGVAGGEFVKRTSFALMATLAVHDKKASDKDFINFFPLIINAATDERNYVRKAVNWALRQIGKRNKKLNNEAIKLANEIKKIESRSAKWIASDALRELRSEPVQNKFKELELTQ